MMKRPSGSEVRRLLELREWIKVESLNLPAIRQQQLLELLERERPWKTDPPQPPEMSRGELIRAIRWRLGTVSLPTATAAARMIEPLLRRSR